MGDFGKPTGVFGTVEQANEDDAVVKWDDDGRVRLHQPWLKKVYPARLLLPSHLIYKTINSDQLSEGWSSILAFAGF